MYYNSKTQKQTSTFLDYNRGLWKQFNPHIYMQEGPSCSFHIFKMKDFFKQKYYYDPHLGLTQLIPKTKNTLNPVTELQKKWTRVSAQRYYTIPLQDNFLFEVLSERAKSTWPEYCQSSAKRQIPPHEHAVILTLDQYDNFSKFSFFANLTKSKIWSKKYMAAAVQKKSILSI